MGANRLLAAINPARDREYIRDVALNIAVRSAAKVANPYMDTDRTLRMWDRHGLTERERGIVVEQFGRLNG